MTLIPLTDVTAAMERTFRGLPPTPAGDAPPTAWAGTGKVPGLGTEPLEELLHAPDRKLDFPGNPAETGTGTGAEAGAGVEAGDGVPSLLAVAFETYRPLRPPDAPKPGFAVITAWPRGGRRAASALYATDGSTTRMTGAEWTASLPGLYTDAPVLFLVCADLGSTAAPAAYGYPALLAGAGALAQAVLLAAEQAGMGGRIFRRGCPAGTVAARRHHPGMRHLLTVATAPTTSRPAASGDVVSGPTGEGGR